MLPPRPFQTLSSVIAQVTSCNTYLPKHQVDGTAEVNTPEVPVQNRQIFGLIVSGLQTQISHLNYLGKMAAHS